MSQMSKKEDEDKRKRRMEWTPAAPMFVSVFIAHLYVAGNVDGMAISCSCVCICIAHLYV